MKPINRRNALLLGAGALVAIVGGTGLGRLLRPENKTNSGEASDGTSGQASSGEASIQTSGRPAMTVYKDAYCGCCTLWVDHMRAAGYNVQTVDVANLGAVKDQLGVARELGSCHTAVIGDYVIEGHVPATAVNRLLDERPQVRGLAVPAMPIGSPGMEVEGREPERYSVLAFGNGSNTVFMEFKGGEALEGATESTAGKS